MEVSRNPFPVGRQEQTVALGADIGQLEGQIAWLAKDASISSAASSDPTSRRPTITSAPVMAPLPSGKEMGTGAAVPS